MKNKTFNSLNMIIMHIINKNILKKIIFAYYHILYIYEIVTIWYALNFKAVEINLNKYILMFYHDRD